MLPKAVMYIDVRSPLTFHPLDGRPLLAWVYDQVINVRGATDPIFVGHNKALMAVLKWKSDREIMELPSNYPNNDDCAMEIWLGERTKKDNSAQTPYAVVRPTMPFLPAARMESCVKAVRTEAGSWCSPGLAPGGHALVEHQSVRVVSPTGGRGPTHCPSTLIELLDASDPDHHCLIEAMVQSGKV